MKKHFYALYLFLLGICSACQAPPNCFEPAAHNPLRAPAYPLVTIDPYTSAWSFVDSLPNDPVRHWTGKPHPLVGALRVDGQSYRFMGVETLPLKTLLPTAATEKWEADYTEQAPRGNWQATHYQPTGWTRGKAAFGTPEIPNHTTPWLNEEIWIRRTFELTEDYSNQTVYLEYSHDDDFTLSINGIPVIETGYAWNTNVLHQLSPAVLQTLKPGKNIITAHCCNRVGGANVDFGLFVKEPVGLAFEHAAVQKSVQVMPTQTFYTFVCGPVELDVVFTAPLLLNNLNLISTPINYLSYQVRATDGKAHNVQIYVDATPQWAIHTPGQETESTTGHTGSNAAVSFAKTGTIEQPILEKKGDDVRIDWGYFYVAAANKSQQKVVVENGHLAKKQFADQGVLSSQQPTRKMRTNEHPVLAMCEDLGKVSTSASGYLMLGYDDIYAVQYFNDNRMAYWKQDGKVTMNQALEKAVQDYPTLMQECRQFDARLMQEAEHVGGQAYARLCALAYRQSIAAHKLVTDKEGNLLFLSKENFSNGSIGTVDITYPSAPLYLLYNPDLLKGMLNPIFYYSESGQWNKPFPAHDVGTYPQANGQTYPEDMPVEESGNMLILTTAIAVCEGNAHYAEKHWDVLTVWADYLLKEGLDPDNQLCTDDFAGHLAHNANLSIKAIIGIAGYGKMADMLGKKEIAEQYLGAARQMAAQWVAMANDGDHYRLTFDQPGTWSQKYNLVWDRLFGLDIFPKEVAQTEVAYYLTKQNKYGLPLDSRKDYTKSDWIMWSACLSADQATFEQLVQPVYLYANETVSRVPLSDWHDTKDSRSPNFRARSVVGGYFMRLLQNKLGR